MGTTRICRMGFDLQDVDALSCAIGIGIGTILAFLLTSFSKAKPTPVNPSIQKDSPKVATMTTVQEVGDTVNASEKGVVAYCRCWRSSKFPLCDGSHTEYNKETGDNTGPLVVKK